MSDQSCWALAWLLMKRHNNSAVQYILLHKTSNAQNYTKCLILIITHSSMNFKNEWVVEGLPEHGLAWWEGGSPGVLSNFHRIYLIFIGIRFFFLWNASNNVLYHFKVQIMNVYLNVCICNEFWSARRPKSEFLDFSGPT